MKKEGVLFIVLMFLATLPLPAFAQECTTACGSNADCTIDQTCTNGCCTSIPCTTTADCPFACPSSVNAFFVSAACNLCVDGVCVDPNCSCDFGESCDGLGPCTDSNHPVCLDGTCHDCTNDCGCCQLPPTGSCTDDQTGNTGDTGCPDAVFNECSGEGTLCCIQEDKDTCNPNVNECQPPGTSTCGFECQTNADCDDQDPCTTDTCDSLQNCVNTPIPGCCNFDSDCNDGLFCNGEETCINNACQSGAFPCDDLDPCTTDNCNEVTDSCSNPLTEDPDGDGIPNGPVGTCCFAPE